MDDDKIPVTRRQLLGTTGSLSLAGFAGCLAGKKKEVPDRPVNYQDAPLPEGAENCVSNGGGERDPEALTAKDEIDYRFQPNYLGESGFIEMCANCQFFCPGEEFDAKVGACSQVAGGIRSQDWCALWQPAENVSSLDQSGARHYYD